MLIVFRVVAVTEEVFGSEPTAFARTVLSVISFLFGVTIVLFVAQSFRSRFWLTVTELAVGLRSAYGVHEPKVPIHAISESRRCDLLSALWLLWEVRWGAQVFVHAVKDMLPLLKI